MKRTMMARSVLLIAVAYLTTLIAQAPKPAVNDPCLGTWVLNAQPKQEAVEESFSCPVTVPSEKNGKYGNEALTTGLWPEGKVVFKPGGAGFVLEDGALAMKFWWWRPVGGRLTIEGRRWINQHHPYGLASRMATGTHFNRPVSFSRLRVAGKSLGASVTRV